MSSVMAPSPSSPADMSPNQYAPLCPMTDPKSGYWIIVTCDPTMIDSTAPDTTTDVPIITMTDPTHGILIVTTSVTGDGPVLPSPVASATSPTDLTPAPTPTPTPTSAKADANIETTLITLPRLTNDDSTSITAIIPVHPNGAFYIPKNPNAIPSATKTATLPAKSPAEDLFSDPYAAYLPGTPPIVIAILCMIVAWTLFFAYAVVLMHRGDGGEARRGPAHPRWVREESLGGLRTPKKVGVMFEMRGLW